MNARRCAALAGAALFAACGGGGGSGSSVSLQPPLDPTYRASGHAAAGDVFVHLFEWRWADIARECETWLGPKGFTGVQISPPSEHLLISSTTSGVSYPWWQRYQTVSYKLDSSRSGTLAELIDMIGRCKVVGVGIYADAVINHMTAANSGSGSAGSVFTSKYAYPAVPYGSSDFHPSCSVTDYNNAVNVQQCELVGLADLRTEDDSVRTKIANYMIALNALGVAGFRIDAAKHMHPRDVDAILGKVNAAADAAGRAKPYAFLEVIDNPGEAVKASDFYGVGYASGGASDITEFLYSYAVTDAFKGNNGSALAGLQNAASGYMPSDKAVVFTDNHDNQRGSNIFYQDAAYELAVVYTLAQPYGAVSVMSSYGFDRTSTAGRDAGPPGSNGATQSTYDSTTGASLCTAQIGSAQIGNWICEHRRRAIANMVAFRHVTAGAPMSNWQQIGTANQIAFARTGTGFAAFNRESAPITKTVSTTLPAGNYCDVVNNDFTPASGASTASCSGGTISVAVDGSASITVPALGAVALHVGARTN